MNIPERIDNLLKKIKEKTINRKLPWVQTSRESEFRCVFPNGTAVTIDYWLNNGRFTDFAVYNDDGAQVDRIAFNEHDLEFEYLFGIYQEVKKSITKSDETYNDLFNSLDQL